MTETKEQRMGQLTRLFNKQRGLCYVCGKLAVLDFRGGSNRKDSGESAVRFRTGSAFGPKGRPRPKVMAHRKCADQRSREMEMGQPLEYLQLRSGRAETETFEIRRD